MGRARRKSGPGRARSRKPRWRGAGRGRGDGAPAAGGRGAEEAAVVPAVPGGLWWACRPSAFPAPDPDSEFSEALHERLGAAMGSGEDLRPGHGSCAHCGRTGANLGRALQACNSCWRVDYCDRECAEAHRAVHCRKREGAGRAPGPPTTCELLQHTSLMEEEEQRVGPSALSAALSSLVPWEGPTGTDWLQFFATRGWERVAWDCGREEDRDGQVAPEEARKRRRTQASDWTSCPGNSGAVQYEESRAVEALRRQSATKEAAMCLVSEAASYPLTLAWALQNVGELSTPRDSLCARPGSPEQSSDGVFRVHVLGASQAECWEPRVWALAAQASTKGNCDRTRSASGQRLLLQMVGPEVPEELHGRTVNMPGGTGTREVTVSGWRGASYKAFTERPDAGRPDLVVGFNMGWTVPTYEWEPSLEVIPSGCCVLATTNSWPEASFDVGFAEDHGMHCKWVGENPFHSLRVHQSGTCANEIYRKNSFAMVFKMRSPCGD